MSTVKNAIVTFNVSLETIYLGTNKPNAHGKAVGANCNVFYVGSDGLNHSTTVAIADSDGKAQVALSFPTSIKQLTCVAIYNAPNGNSPSAETNIDVSNTDSYVGDVDLTIKNYLTEPVAG